MEQTFYYPDRTPISSKSDFLDFYSKLYYWKNSKLVEDKIIELYLKNEPYCEEDIFDILAWKTGKVRHYQSQLNKHVVYYKGWDKNNLNTQIYLQSFDIHKITDALKTLRSKNVCLQNYIDEFKNSDLGIGPVYLITLMSFNTRGKEFIYDRFAAYAMREISTDKLEISEPDFSNINTVYESYKKCFLSNFNSEIKRDNEKAYIRDVRKVDQALWAYGHCLFVSRKYGTCNTI